MVLLWPSAKVSLETIASLLDLSATSYQHEAIGTKRSLTKPSERAAIAQIGVARTSLEATKERVGRSNKTNFLSSPYIKTFWPSRSSAIRLTGRVAL